MKASRGRAAPRSRAVWLVGLVALSGCIWDTQLARASAGGPLSKPRVEASVYRHYENMLTWGTSTTYHLAVSVDGRRYEASLHAGCDQVRISRNRKVFAVQCPPVNQWQLYTLGESSADGGVGSLVSEGEPEDQLSWPEGATAAPHNFSWIVWPLGLFGVGAFFYLLTRVSRRVRRFFTKDVP